VTPHAPQLVEVVSATQLPLQSVKPDLQAYEQAPATHVASALATSVEQPVVQAPQWRGSVFRSVHMLSHWSGELDGQLPVHW
jgi:hypothetical protein